MRSNEPNMLGVSILALVLGLLFTGFAVHAKLTGAEVDANGVILGACLLTGAALAYLKHRELVAMTPEARARYWAAKDAEWQRTADSHARAQLGDDYRPRREKDEP